MAEITAFRNNALPYPVYGVPWTVVFPLLDADGDPVTGETCDSEVSKNGDTAIDCTNEGAEIPFTTATNKGMYYLTLTAAEMTADIVAVTIYAANSKATPIVLYPRKLVTLASGTSAGGAVGYITLAAATVKFDGQFNGCLCVATIDAGVEARMLQACTLADQQCTVTPNWNVAPDADDTYIVYLPEGRQIPESNVRAVSDDKIAADNLELACDNYSVTRGLTGTALPAVVGGANGGVPLGDANGRVDVSKWLGQAVVATVNGRPVVDMQYILGHLLTQTGTQVADGFEHFFDHATPAITVGDAMRGTDSAALAATALSTAVWTAARAGVLTDWINGGRLDLLLDAIPTTAMRGTDSAALASVWTVARAGALTDWIDGGRLDLLLDAIPTTAMRGTDNAALAATALSTAVWTAARAGVLTDWINGGRLDLLLDAIPTTAMRGTDNAALAATALSTAIWTAARAGVLTDWIDGGRLDLLLDAIPTTVMRGTDNAALAAVWTAARAGALTDWIDGGRLDLLLDAIKVITDALTAVSATQLALSAGTIVSGAAAAGTLSTTQMTTNLTEVTNDHYNGRIIIWTSGVLKNQATDITDYVGATKLLEYTAVTEAPTAGDTFIIV